MAIKNKTFSITGVATTDPVDILETTDIKVAWMVVVEGTVTYSIEHTLDGINYIDNSDAVNQTANLDGNYILPIRAVRAKITAGTGSITLVVRQLVV